MNVQLKLSHEVLDEWITNSIFLNGMNEYGSTASRNLKRIYRVNMMYSHCTLFVY